jgi:uncharacterized cupredoxin-like copper-binding protein
MRKTLGLAGALVILLAACGGASPTTKPAESQPAPPTQAASQAPAEGRTVNLEIGAGKITPASVDVKKGETITFVAKNVSTVEVELIVGLQADVAADSGDSLKEAEEIAPGASKTVVYTFDGDGPYAYGDQIGDHYAAGAKGTINLQP